MDEMGSSRPGSNDGDDVIVEVFVDSKWVRGRVHKTRRGEAGQETLVSWPIVEGEAVHVREAWVDHRHIRAVPHEE